MIALKSVLLCTSLIYHIRLEIYSIAFWLPMKLRIRCIFIPRLV